MENTPNAYAEVMELLADTSRQVEEILSDPMHSSQRMTITSALKRLQGPLSYLSGVPATGAVQSVLTPFNLADHHIKKDDADYDPDIDEFGPPAPLVIIDEKLEETNILREKVDKLYDIWETITPEGIVNDYANTPNGQLIVRAVMGRLGIENFEQAPINVETIAEVTMRKEERLKREAEEAEANRKLAEQKKLKQVKAV